MTEVAFYHLTRTPLETVLPKLLEKTLAVGKRAVVLAGSAQRVEHLNSVLWMYDPSAWLPHGSAEDGSAVDGSAVDQPIWLSERDENPNGATFLFLTDGAQCAAVGAYERCFELFDGTCEETLLAARARWKAYTEQGLALSYWQQTETGGWRKKEI